MAKNLVIVESPSKSHTIEKYLGKDYKVVSSKGHIRDLSNKGKYGFGVDVENGFEPDYAILAKQKKTVTELKKDIANSDFVYLATDPDREGEAISWHLKDALKIKDDKYDRIVFNEITKTAILEALKHPRKIDENLVNSQKTRTILDKIIGYRLSKLIQSKTEGSSAGRVQSVALKLIVDRQREIDAFIKEEYWTLTAHFKDFDASLFNYNHEDIKISTRAEAENILSKLSNIFKIEDVKEQLKSKKSKFPYTTSTLQQDASNKLNMNAKKTMSVAQKLYEGIELANETAGLITYMRTDSVRLSDEFVASTYKYIELMYGKDYVGVIKKAKNSANSQDAHEAIRPTDINRTPESVKPYLSNDEYKLYKMIYARALASLMKDAKTKNTTVILDNNNYQFKVNGQIVVFDGYLKVYSDYEDTSETILPDFKSYNVPTIMTDDKEIEQHFTQPPSQFTEAKLIKEMEELGIGRPSTYANTMDIIKTRGYAKIVEKKFVPTEIGIEITDKLQESFSHLINVKYTAQMETDLDKISEGDAVWNIVLDKFYKEFEPAVQDAFLKLPKKEAQKTGEDCPLCGSPLVVRKGKYGTFAGCSNYPKCRYIKVEEQKVVEVTKCPNCDGMIVEKKSKRGKVFYGCSNYPKCKLATWDKPTGELCPDCKNVLVEKKEQIKCSSCEYEK